MKYNFSTWKYSSTLLRCNSLLLLTTGDVIKCSKLQVEQVEQVVSLHSFEHLMDASSVINKSTDARKTVCNLFFTKKTKLASGQGFDV